MGYVNTSGSATAAGGTSDYHIDVTNSGYKALGIVGVLLSAAGACTIVTYRLETDTSAFVRIRNNGTSASTPGGIAVHVLYEKI